MDWFGDTFFIISTHAPLAGRDYSCWFRSPQSLISTHAPLAGRDLTFAPENLPESRFQPTRPLRGATQRGLSSKGIRRYFNPRAPCGARRGREHDCGIHGCHFNPRAPCGARRLESGTRRGLSLFQPTRPLRGATRRRSIIRNRHTNFNPRAPCGARRSTTAPRQRREKISTHAPLAGRDRLASPSSLLLANFNPRAPCGARPFRLQFCMSRDRFQPTRPLRGATTSAT